MVAYILPSPTIPITIFVRESWRLTLVRTFFLMNDQFNLNQHNILPLDRDELKAEWMAMMQQLSGDIWTDYNSHDPGITIMEQLCDVLAKTHQTTSTPVQNLLNSQSRRKREEINNAFYDAAEILPTNPVTLSDYRILIIDRVQFVNNAWIEPVRDNMQGIQGLYRIMLQLDDRARTPEGIQKVKQSVFSLFNQHRNLCEDIESIQILDVDKIEVYADIDISTDVKAEEILAEILFVLEEHLNPSIKYHTLEDLITEGYTVDAIFDGPAPVHGFVKKTDLRPMPKEIYVSKLIELIQSIPGIRRITYFRVDQNGIPAESDVIPLRINTYPVLDMDVIDSKYADEGFSYPVQFYRGALNYELDLNTANHALHSLYARYKKGYQLKMLYHEKDYPSTISLKDIGSYNTFQNSLPVTYGVNELGLPNYTRATRQRVAMVKQLRGYLLFFEQMICNYLEQLVNVRKLFSIDKDIDKTYYTNIPDDLPGLVELMGASTVEQFKQKLEDLSKDFDPFIDRRNRFLDHLLARFGEQFSTDFLLKVSHYVGIGDDDDDTDPEIELINAKIVYLQNYVNISKNRGKGFDYLGRGLDQWNVSGLEKRACLLLDIKNTGNEFLVEILDGTHQDEPTLEAFDYYVHLVGKNDPGEFINLENLHQIQSNFDNIANEELEDEIKEELDILKDELEDDATDKKTDDTTDEIEENEEDHTQDKDENNYKKKFVFRAKNKDLLIKNLLSAGIKKHNYIVLPANGKKSFNIYYKGFRKMGVFKVREVSTRLAATVAIKEFIHYLHKINHYSEGMHVIEHILLRPQAKDQHGFVLSDDQDYTILESYEFGDINAQRSLADDLPSAGSQRANYSIKQDEDNKYSVILSNNKEQPIARFPLSFEDEEDARRQLIDIVDYVRSFKDSPISIYDNIKFTTKARKEMEDHSDDFYSLNLTIVLPTWPSRFQNPDYQDLLRKITMLNAPVYVHIDFLWLNIDEMRSFETVYFDWLEERVALDPKQPALDDKAQAVMNYLITKE